jgi:hypothetical protein
VVAAVQDILVVLAMVVLVEVAAVVQKLVVVD